MEPSGDVGDLVAPLSLVPGIGSERQERDQILNAASPVDQENAGRIMPGGQVIIEMDDHRIPIEGDQYPSHPFSPEEDVGVAGPEWKVGRVAHANGIDRLNDSKIMVLDGPPERPTLILIQQINKHY